MKKNNRYRLMYVYKYCSKYNLKAIQIHKLHKN